MDCLKVNNSVQQLYNYAANNDYNAVYSTREFYREGIKNPTMALLISNGKYFSYCLDLTSDFRDCFHSGDFKGRMSNMLQNLLLLRCNIEKAKQHPLVQEYQDKFVKEMTENLYPLSAATRVALIKSGHILPDTITPKVHGLKKFLLRIKIKKCASDLQQYVKALL